MRRGLIHAPPALLILGGHAPMPARVELVYEPALGRLLRALFSLIFFWSLVPYVIWVPPHYPWAFAALAAGLYLPYRFWTGKYVIRSFSGSCPRCERALSLESGARIDLPHTLTCYHCHFESVLEVSVGEGQPARERTRPARAEHRQADCVGVWSLQWWMDQQWAVCRACGARCLATAEVRRAVEAENERDRVLQQLTSEGRFLL